MKSVENEQICKTSKLIKWTRYVFLVYVLLCFISILALFVSIELFQRDMVDMAMYLQPLWMLNPMVPVVSCLGVATYLIEWREAAKGSPWGKSGFSLFSTVLFPQSYGWWQLFSLWGLLAGCREVFLHFWMTACILPPVPPPAYFPTKIAVVLAGST